MAVKKKSVKRKVGRPARKTTTATRGRKKTTTKGRKKTTTKGRKKGASRGRKKTTKKSTKKRKRSAGKTKKPAKKAKKVRKVTRRGTRSKEMGETFPLGQPESEEKTKPSIFPTTFKAGTGSKLLRDFLTEKKIPFEVIKHSPAFTAQQIAANAHISGKQVAKTVIVKIDGKMAMMIEPAHIKIDLAAVKRQLNAQRVELASESEFRNRFPDCEIGAMPPFGNLYGMDVFISDNISRDEFITFNAGTHSELLKMSYKDFYNLVHPKVVYA